VDRSPSRKLTITDIAKRARVSRATVSLVLRESPLVADETRARVQKIVASLGYVRNRGAANLRSRNSQTIGLILSDLANPFYAELIAGIESVMDENGRIAFIVNTEEDPVKQDRLILRPREQNVEGIILSAAEGTDPGLIDRLRQWRLPCVQTMRRLNGRLFDYVGPAIKRGVEMAVDHLAERGHRSIAYIGASRRTSPTRERLAGFSSAMSKRGLRQDLIVRCPPTREEGAHAIRELLAGPTPPTAAVCYNDVCAFGVVLGFMEAGGRPGADFGVVGFDNIADAAFVRPALTTVAIDPRRLGQESARLLLRRIASPDASPERLVVPSHLIVRET